MQIERPQFIPVLEVFRAYAVVSVVCLHFLLLIQNKLPYFIWISLIGWVTYGVAIFFIISGYVLAYSYEGLIPKISTFRRRLVYFWWRRLLRIYPAYLCALIILWFVQKNYNYQDLIVHLLNIHNFYSAYHRSINGVFWSLAVEFQWYFFAPFIIHIILCSSWKSGVFILGITTLMSVLVKSYVTYLYVFANLSIEQFALWNNDQLINHLFSFVLGVMVYRFRGHSNYSGIPFIILLYMLSLLYVLFHQEQITQLFPEGVFIQIILYYLMQLLLGLVLYTYQDVQLNLTSIAGRILRFIAKISYGLYIWHLPVLNYLSSFSMPSGLFFILYFFISVLLSSLSYYGVERWFLRRRNA